MPHGFTLPTPTSPATPWQQGLVNWTANTPLHQGSISGLCRSSAVTEEAQSKMALLRVCGFLWGFLLLRNQNYPGSESRARMPVLVQIGLDSAYFLTQYTEQPSCSLQARVGPARLSLAFTAPRGRVPSGNGASIQLSLQLALAWNP